MNRIRPLQFAIGLNVLAVVILLVSILLSVASPYEITRIRNSLIFSSGAEEDFRWRPNSRPGEFLNETMPPPALIQRSVDELMEAMPSDASNFDKARRLAEHLSSGPGRGDGIMSDTLTTYKTILTEEKGYCADYTQVFDGLAIAAGIPVREWGISFGGFNGRGHAINEIYDYRLDKWILIDSFYSMYVTDSRTGVPLSVLEFQSLLKDEASQQFIAVHPIDPRRYAFKNKERFIRYFYPGVDQFYLWFGNNVYSYYQNALVRTVGVLGRAAEQSTAILVGLQPEIRLLPTKDNSGLISELADTRRRFLIEAVSLVVLTIVLVGQLGYALKRRRRLH